MKNSATTKNTLISKSRSWLLSIDESRLAYGLLTLLITGAIGYGVWTGVSWAIGSDSAPSNPIPLRRVADEQFKFEKYTDAAATYAQIFEADPNNGFAAWRVAAIEKYYWRNAWKEIRKLESQEVPDELEIESLQKFASNKFDRAIFYYRKLLDFARYRANAYLSLGSMHSECFLNTGDAEQVELSVDIINEMLEEKLYSQYGLDEIGALAGIRKHPEYSRLVQRELNVRREHGVEDIIVLPLRRAGQ